MSERAWAIADAPAAAFAVVDWARESVALMRRPRGVDDIFLSLTVRDGDGRPLEVQSAGIVRPGWLYSEAAIEWMEWTLRRLAKTEAERPGVEVVAVVVRLGDLAHAMDAA